MPKRKIKKKSILSNKIAWSIAAGVVIVALLVFFIVKHKRIDETEILRSPDSSESRSEGFVEESQALSRKLMEEGLQKLRSYHPKEAVEDYRRAVDIYPLNTRAYGYLVEFYMMTGQEEEMYKVLTLAGRSFPNFNQIVNMIKDEVIDKWLPNESPDNIFLANFPQNKKMAISFMFDDGENSTYEKGLPLFEKYGYRATIPIVAGRVVDNDNDLYWASWREWADAAKRGFEIANHSMYHRDSRELHGTELELATDGAKEKIEKTVGCKVTAYVFPFDRFNDEAIHAALHSHKSIREGNFLRSFYKSTVGIVYGGNRFSVETANRLIDIGLKRGLWIIAQGHGIVVQGRPSFKAISESFLDTHLAYIHSKSQEIWVDTFSKVFDYLSLRSHSWIEIKGFSDNSYNFILHNKNPDEKLSVPMTVIIKTRTVNPTIKSVQSKDGHVFKAWPCDKNRICVDVDIYEKEVELEWI